MIETKVFNPLTVADGIAEMDFANPGECNSGGAGVFWSAAGGPSRGETQHFHAEDPRVE